MGRPKRAADGGLVYHVLNRANARMTIFESDADYAAFEQVLEEAVERTPTRLLAYCVMPTHWHLVVWPQEDGALSRFMAWLTLTHTHRWHAQRHSAGTGHVYQGRFKSFPVQADEHFYTLCRYVERNALRAKLVPRAEQWRWGSLHRWKSGTAKEKAALAAWPLPRLARLGGPRERGAIGRGVAGRASPCAAWESVRRSVLVRPDGPPLGPGKHASPPRPPQEAQ